MGSEAGRTLLQHRTFGKSTGGLVPTCVADLVEECREKKRRETHVDVGGEAVMVCVAVARIATDAATRTD